MRDHSAEILADASFDKNTLTSIALGMCHLVQSHAEYRLSLVDLEQAAMDLLCDAIRAGAFPGPEWRTWKTVLARYPHIQSAIQFLAEFAPIEHQEKGGRIESPKSVRILADLIADFADEPIAARALTAERLTTRQRSIVKILQLLDADDRLQAKEIHKGLPPPVRKDCEVKTLIRHDLARLKNLRIIKHDRGRGYFAADTRAARA